MKDGLTIAQFPGLRMTNLQVAVNALEMQSGLQARNTRITGVQLAAEKEKKQPWWKIALYILRCLSSGYGIGSM